MYVLRNVEPSNRDKLFEAKDFNVNYWILEKFSQLFAFEFPVSFLCLSVVCNTTCAFGKTLFFFQLCYLTTLDWLER